MNSKVKNIFTDIVAILFLAAWLLAKFVPKLAPMEPLLSAAAVPLVSFGLLGAYSGWLQSFLPDDLKAILAAAGDKKPS